MGRREEVLDGAIEVLGTLGLRGLTHRAVDGTAGVPAGTASNYFRSRAALVRGVVERLVEEDLAFWAAFDGVQESTPGDVAERLAEFVRWSIGDGRVRGVARLNLFAAAAVEPDLREPLRRGRRAVELVGEQVGAAIGLGVAESALVMDATDALITRQLAMPTEGFDPLPALTTLLTRLR
ncbi:TetR family transcriptional regulator [Tsukamurella sp. M9C]|uniref:TetR/AcrR family transcriptional regulator n=1 Tax=unclassified Tsukamurella TaxID=2633480 RepID=UPI001CCA617B|nr:TetR family transcriptional regulator [Tsukamurella sp. M9C]MCA0158324.1 TetR family transcriptional regulator [Tsukamurella sp. M9C]